jgi:hypothetical protein
MKSNLIVFLSFFIFIGCTNSNKNTIKLIDYVPQNSVYIIKTNNLESLKSNIKNNLLISELKNYSTSKNFISKIKNLEFLNTSNEILFSISLDSKDSMQITAITKLKEDIFNTDSLPDLKIETIKSNKRTLTKTSINNEPLYSMVMDSLFLISSSKETLENAKPNYNTDLHKIYSTIDDSKLLSVLINSRVKNSFPKLFNILDLNFTNYSLLDIDIAQNEIIFNGITQAIDSTSSFINCFKNNVPQENLISKMCPTDIESFNSFTFKNFNEFYKQKSNYLKGSLELERTEFNSVIEFGNLSKADQNASVIRCIDPNTVNDAFVAESISESYRSVEIFSFNNFDDIKNSFSPFFNNSSASYYFNIDDFFVLSSDIEFLKTIISNYQNNTSLYDYEPFKNIMKKLSDESSIFIYKNDFGLNQLFNNNFQENLDLKISNYKASAMQFVYDSDFAHINGITKIFKTKVSSNSVSEELNIKLDNDLISSPQIIINHTNNEKDIVVQDLKNNLYLISNKGKVFWKKQLDGKILGDIKQIDMFKNGRLQMVFNTSKHLYILDRNGKDVSNFPLKFKDNITQPVAVFDYDNKKNYRLLITQNKSLLMYDKNGKSVSGFTYKKAENSISTQPEHFRIGNKDFIVFEQGETLEILDRVGKTRIPVNRRFNFSTNPIFLYNNSFTTTDSNGSLISVTSSGNISTTQLNLSQNHKISTTSKTLVTLSDNKLTIKSKTIELDFGDYTPPKIFYLNDKIYVTVTDLQSKKVYLFDSQAKPISNFPVYGNSSIELSNIDKDKNLELVAKGDSNSIIIYKIN